MKEKMKTKRKKDRTKGITLIALVITIIVLLILAAVSVITLTGENGIVTKAQESKNHYKKAEIKEEIELAITEIRAEFESSNPQESWNHNELKQKLPDKLSTIIINEDMTGEYKEHSYWIDENNRVHVEEKVDNPEKSRTYLIKNGKPQIQGQTHNSAKVIEKDDYLNIKIDLIAHRSGYYFLYDLSKYKKIKTDVEVISKTGGASCIFLWILKEGPDGEQKEELEKYIASPNDTSVERKIHEIDVENVTGEYYICHLKNANIDTNRAEFNIYNLWLEE